MGEPPYRVGRLEESKMKAENKERFARAVIELIETDPEVRSAVMRCACRSPNIVKVV